MVNLIKQKLSELKNRSNPIDLIWLAALLVACFFVAIFSGHEEPKRVIEVVGIIYIFAGTLYLSGGAFVSKAERVRLNEFVNYVYVNPVVAADCALTTGDTKPPIANITEQLDPAIESRKIVSELFLNASHRQYLGMLGITFGTFIILAPEQIVHGYGWLLGRF